MLFFMEYNITLNPLRILCRAYTHEYRLRQHRLSLQLNCESIFTSRSSVCLVKIPHISDVSDLNRTSGAVSS